MRIHRFFNISILLIACLIMSLSGCKAARKSTPEIHPAPLRVPLMRMPIPFSPERTAPTTPRSYEEQVKPTPPPPAPAVSWFNKMKWQPVTRRSRKDNRLSQNSQSLQSYQLQNIFGQNPTSQGNQIRFGNSHPQHLSASEFNKQNESTRYQVVQPNSKLMTYHQYYSNSHQQPIVSSNYQPVAISFDAMSETSQPRMNRSVDQQHPVVSEYQEQQPIQKNGGIANWSEANWLTPSDVSDWNRRRPTQMNPSNKILPVMSVPQDASSADLEQWPHLEREIPSHEQIEELEPPVFDKDERVIIIQPRSPITSY